MTCCTFWNFHSIIKYGTYGCPIGFLWRNGGACDSTYHRCSGDGARCVPHTNVCMRVVMFSFILEWCGIPSCTTPVQIKHTLYLEREDREGITRPLYVTFSHCNKVRFPSYLITMEVTHHTIVSLPSCV